jgi:hypothetical protein
MVLTPAQNNARKLLQELRIDHPATRRACAKWGVSRSSVNAAHVAAAAGNLSQLETLRRRLCTASWRRDFPLMSSQQSAPARMFGPRLSSRSGRRRRRARVRHRPLLAPTLPPSRAPTRKGIGHRERRKFRPLKAERWTLVVHRRTPQHVRTGLRDGHEAAAAWAFNSSGCNHSGHCRPQPGPYLELLVVL